MEVVSENNKGLVHYFLLYTFYILGIITLILLLYIYKKRESNWKPVLSSLTFTVLRVALLQISDLPSKVIVQQALIWTVKSQFGIASRFFFLFLGLALNTQNKWNYGQSKRKRN